MEMSVQLPALGRQVAPPAFSDAPDIGHRAPMSGNVGSTCRPPAASCTSRIFRCIGYWLSGTDEWKCRSNLPPACGKLHLPHFPMEWARFEWASSNPPKPRRQSVPIPPPSPKGGVIIIPFRVLDIGCRIADLLGGMLASGGLIS